MAKKNESLADVLRTTALVWLGKTNIDNTDVLLVNFNKTLHLVVVETTEEELILKSKQETIALSKEIFKVLYEINPLLIEKHVSTTTTSLLPKGLEILEDYNLTLFDRGIKPLKVTTVAPFLDNIGINTTKYNYTHAVVDNSHTLTQDWVDKGYSNYSPDVLSIMADTSKYITYTMEKRDEYEMMDMGCYHGIVAAGPAGTGKSTDALIYCATEKIPVVVFQCTPGTEEDAIIGNFIPSASGGFTLKRGPLANAIEQDCWLVINEANYVPSGILSCLNSVMDDNAQVLLDDGSMLKRGKNFRLILTVNPGYRGTNMFNEATLNRFATVYYEPITKLTLINRLQHETGYKNTKVLEAIAEQFDKLRNIYLSKNMETEVTYRNVLRFVKMILLARHIDIKKQFDMAFINNAIFEMNDISTELEDLQSIGEEMLKDITSALESDTKDAKEGTWSCTPEHSIDTSIQVNDDASFLDFDEEE